MDAIRVLVELVPLATLLFLVCGAVFAHERGSGRTAGWRKGNDRDIGFCSSGGASEEPPATSADRPWTAWGEDDEPEWWSDFEREFALYVAKKIGRHG